MIRSTKRKLSKETKHTKMSSISKKHHHSDTIPNDNNSLLLDDCITSKVAYESVVKQNFVTSLPKTKDQCVMAQIDVKNQLNKSNNIHRKAEKKNQITTERMSSTREGKLPNITGSNSVKSSIRELFQNQKSIHRRKSKSQHRARKAVRTITFILGMFNKLFRLI